MMNRNNCDLRRTFKKDFGEYVLGFHNLQVTEIFESIIKCHKNKLYSNNSRMGHMRHAEKVKDQEELTGIRLLSVYKIFITMNK